MNSCWCLSIHNPNQSKNPKVPRVTSIEACMKQAWFATASGSYKQEQPRNPENGRQLAKLRKIRRKRKEHKKAQVSAIFLDFHRLLQGTPPRGRQLYFTFPSALDPLFKASEAPFLTLRVATPSGAPRQAPLEIWGAFLFCSWLMRLQSMMWWRRHLGTSAGSREYRSELMQRQMASLLQGGAGSSAVPSLGVLLPHLAVGKRWGKLFYLQLEL